MRASLQFQRTSLFYHGGQQGGMHSFTAVANTYIMSHRPRKRQRQSQGWDWGGLARLFETSEPTYSDTVPPTRAHLLQQGHSS